MQTSEDVIFLTIHFLFISQLPWWAVLLYMSCVYTLSCCKYHHLWTQIDNRRVSGAGALLSDCPYFPEMVLTHSEGVGTIHVYNALDSFRGPPPPLTLAPSVPPSPLGGNWWSQLFQKICVVPQSEKKTVRVSSNFVRRSLICDFLPDDGHDDSQLELNHQMFSDEDRGASQRGSGAQELVEVHMAENI